LNTTWMYYERNLKKNNRNITEDSVWSSQEPANHDRTNINSKMLCFLMISWKECCVLVWFHIPNNLHYMFIYSFSKLYIYIYIYNWRFRHCNNWWQKWLVEEERVTRLCTALFTKYYLFSKLFLWSIFKKIILHI
jgi:hypothetical protein